MSRGDFGSKDYGSTSAFGSATYRPANAENEQELKIFSEISGKIFRINKNVSTLEYVSRGIDDDEPGRKKEDKVHEISRETNQLAKETKNCFRKAAELTDVRHSGMSTDKERRSRLQRNKLKTEFENALSRYHAIQGVVSSKMKNHIEHELRMPADGSLDLSNISDSDTQQLINHNSQSQVQAQIDEQEVEVWREREERFREIEADILNVNEIFQDLALLVHEQGEQIDSIEGNIETAAVQVEEGRVQLQRAKSYQKSARKRICILISILLVVALILGLIIYFSVKKD